MISQLKSDTAAPPTARLHRLYDRAYKTLLQPKRQRGGSGARRNKIVRNEPTGAANKEVSYPGVMRKQSKSQQHSKKSPAKILVVFADTIRKIPKGKVASYGQVAAAAGFPGAARQVVRALHSFHGLPWHRVVGAGGAIRVPGEDALEQRLRLEMEGVAFLGRRVNMERHQFRFRR